MEKKRILLINCAITMEGRKKINEAVSSPSLGLMSISSMLTMHGYQVKIIDFFVERITGNEFVQILNSYRPDVIGFSVYTRTVPFLRKIVDILGKVKYKGILVAGGPHASFCQEEMLNEYKMDFVISGEGEFTFVKLMEHICYGNAYPLNKIDGIAYKQENKIWKNKNAKLITKLDALPIQPIGMIDSEKYSSPFSIITSRGCPGNCIYCSSRALAGNEYRMRSAENILCEVIYLSKKLGSITFIILDDTFTADENRFIRFAFLLKRCCIPFQFRIESRGDVLNQNILETLSSVNCKIIHIGIESGSQEVIRKIGKKIELRRTVDILYEGVALGMHMVASFIIGHHCDTDDTVQETLALMRELTAKGVEVSVASCTPFPGTPLYENMDKLQVKLHATSWQDFDFGNVIISTSFLTQEKLRGYLFEAAQICINQQ